MKTIDVREFIADTKFNGFHAAMLAWICVIITFDMYDLVIYGSVLPVLMKQWGMTPVEAGAIGSYGFFGMMLGAIAFGMLADRYGRKRVLLASVVLFSAATALCGFAPNPLVFSVFRFIAGIGIGGILPSGIAMLTDYAPRGRASTFVAIIMCFFHVGGILAAVAAIFLIPALGWQGVYWIAAAPLLLVPFMGRYFLDSPAMLAASGRHDELRVALTRVSGQPLPADVQFTGFQAKEPGSRIGALFTNRRALGTLMIWTAFFMCLLMINGLSVWLPNLMVKSGFALGSSLTFLIVLNLGAIAGTLLMGRLADRFGVKRVLVPMYVVAAISLALLGFGGSMGLLLALVFVTGACTMGAQNISYAFVSQYYPSFMRSTAIGLASAVGRVGAIVGPLFGGVLLQLALPVQTNFTAFAIPGFVAALAFLFVPLGRSGGRTGELATGAAATPDREAVR